jgi:hypothetical protein
MGSQITCSDIRRDQFEPVCSTNDLLHRRKEENAVASTGRFDRNNLGRLQNDCDDADSFNGSYIQRHA